MDLPGVVRGLSIERPHHRYLHDILRTFIHPAMVHSLIQVQLTKTTTGFRQTRVLVSKVIRLTIETGSLTGMHAALHARQLETHLRIYSALAAVINLTLFFAFPGHTYYTVPAALMPKLYANSILIILNARFQILGGRATYTSSMDIMSTPTYLRNTETIGSAATRSHLVAINREAISDAEVQNDVEMKGVAV
jgi:hypothetical protein